MFQLIYLIFFLNFLLFREENFRRKQIALSKRSEKGATEQKQKEKQWNNNDIH